MENTDIKRSHKKRHAGRPRVITRSVVCQVIRVAKAQRISERAAAIALGYKPVSIAVNKARLGMTKKYNYNYTSLNEIV